MGPVHSTLRDGSLQLRWQGPRYRFCLRSASYGGQVAHPGQELQFGIGPRSAIPGPAIISPSHARCVGQRRDLSFQRSDCRTPIERPTGSRAHRCPRRTTPNLTTTSLMTRSLTPPSRTRGAAMAGWRGLTTRSRAQRKTLRGWTGWFPEWNAAAKARGPRKQAPVRSRPRLPGTRRRHQLARFAIKA
ncbi:hypothetical protein ACVWZZ_008144 [Bradyrhizobium sp. LM6.10]